MARIAIRSIGAINTTVLVYLERQRYRVIKYLPVSEVRLSAPLLLQALLKLALQKIATSISWQMLVRAVQHLQAEQASRWHSYIRGIQFSVQMEKPVTQISGAMSITASVSLTM